MPRKAANNPVENNEGGETPSIGFQVFDRASILKSINVQSEFSTFEELVDITQRLISEMFLNQAAICLKLQQDYMNRKRPVFLMDEFRVLKIVTDLMREVTAYDFGVDTNRAWEFLERQGYKINDSDRDDKTSDLQ